MNRLNLLDLTEQAKDKQVWVVGDIHGEFTMFQALLDKIGYDPATHLIITVGDMVDRGSDSPSVVEWFRHHGHSVLGNHEDMWLNTIKGIGMPYDGQGINEGWLKALPPGWLRSNGVDQTLRQFMDRGIPAETWLDFFASLPHGITVGDWLVVHAGVNPRRTFAQQSPDEVIWIRDEFLVEVSPPESRAGKMLVVGHNETFWLGSLGNPVLREDAVFIDIGTASSIALGAICLNNMEFVEVEHSNRKENMMRINVIIAAARTG